MKIALNDQPHNMAKPGVERGSVTRSSIACHQALDNTNAYFATHVLRLTEPRSCGVSPTATERA